MQKLFEFSFPSEKHFPALKKLWHDVFGDSECVINNFFEKTLNPQNVICAFYEDEPVSVLYAVDSRINVGGVFYKAYYVYAVCTKVEFRGNGLSLKTLEFLEKVAKERGYSYLFLVPAEAELFNFYKKAGYCACFTYKEECVLKKDFEECESTKIGFDYNKYKELKNKFHSVPYTFFEKQGFDSFCEFVGDEMKSVCIDDGYAIYEMENNRVVVHECIGNKRELLSCIFYETDVQALYVREPSDENGRFYGMLKSLDGSPLFYNGFLGVSYGG